MKAPEMLSQQRPQSAFNVVIAYEDFDAGRRAMDACKPLVSQLGDGVQFRSCMWKFEVLRSAKLKQIAVSDALEADLIIVATGPAGDLPDEVRNWMESWVPGKRGQTAALLALLDWDGPEAEPPLRCRNYLKAAAASAGIDFLSQSDSQQEPPSLITFGVELPADRIINGPAPEGWGLND